MLKLRCWVRAPTLVDRDVPQLGGATCDLLLKLDSNLIIKQVNCMCREQVGSIDGFLVLFGLSELSPSINVRWLVDATVGFT